MSRRPSDQEIDRVHKYIEYCMMHHMTKRETMDCIASQANIEPIFTQTIWEQLEAENQEFFRAYYIRLAVRGQTVRFNDALSMQAQLMHQQNGNNGLPHPSNGSQQAMMHQQHNGNNGLQHRSNGSQQQALMHQHNGNNGLQHHSNGSQQQALMHQHNGNDGLQHRPNGSQQQALMHQHNGLQHRSNGSQQQALMHQHNGLVHHSNGSQQQVLMHQHNANNVSHALQVSTPNSAQLSREAMQQQQVLNSSTSSTLSNLQGMNEQFVQSYAGTPMSHFSSSSNFPESSSLMGDQAESSSAQNPVDFLVDPEEVESADGSTNISP